MPSAACQGYAMTSSILAVEGDSGSSRYELACLIAKKSGASMIVRPRLESAARRALLAGANPAQLGNLFDEDAAECVMLAQSGTLGDWAIFSRHLMSAAVGEALVEEDVSLEEAAVSAVRALKEKMLIFGGPSIWVLADDSPIACQRRNSHRSGQRSSSYYVFAHYLFCECLSFLAQKSPQAQLVVLSDYGSIEECADAAASLMVRK